MAKATATCTCATCGAMFTRTKICRNRREADGWEVWAAANFDECDACYTARKASEREAAAAAETELPLTLHMTGYPYKDSTPRLASMYAVTHCSSVCVLLQGRRFPLR